MRDSTHPDNIPKTLIFCKTKAQCVKIRNMLTKVTAHKGLTTMYHATLSDETKKFIYYNFITAGSDLRCIVCTIAFGMVRPKIQCSYIHIFSYHYYVYSGNGHSRHCMCDCIWAS